MDSFWAIQLIGNPLKDWAIAFGIIVLSSLAFPILQTVILNRVEILTFKTSSTIDDFMIGIIRNSVMPLLYVLGLQYLQFSLQVEKVLSAAVLIIAIFFFTKIFGDI